MLPLSRRCTVVSPGLLFGELMRRHCRRPVKILHRQHPPGELEGQNLAGRGAAFIVCLLVVRACPCKLSAGLSDLVE